MISCLQRYLHQFSQPRLLLTLIAGLPLPLAAQPDSLSALARPGPFQVAYYNQLPEAAEYSGATLYFPANRGTDFGGVAIAPGFTESQENIDWWGRHLSSHGFAVMVLDTNSLRDGPQLRAAALMAALDTIRGEGERSGSPIRGKILNERMAVMGHSMGGGGSLLAAGANGDQLQAIIPFNPWLPDGDLATLQVPTLMIAGEDDRIAAVADHAWPLFQSLPDATPRMYVEFAGGNHFIANSVTDDEGLRPNIDVRDSLAALGVAWLKLFLDGDEDYRAFLFEGLPDEQREQLSRLEFAQ